MKVNVFEGEDQVTLSVIGEVEVYSLPDFSQIAEKQIGSRRQVVIDMEDLEYIDSSGLGFIVTYHERLSQKGQQLSLINLRPHVMRVFKITRLDQILDIVETEPAS
jgi:anti-sigma B factor antagonist